MADLGSSRVGRFRIADPSDRVQARQPQGDSDDGWLTTLYKRPIPERRFAVCFIVAVLIAGGIYAVMFVRPWESPIDRAYRICEPCGGDRAQVDRLVNTIRTSGADRETGLRLFRDTL